MRIRVGEVWRIETRVETYLVKQQEQTHRRERENMGCGFEGNSVETMQLNIDGLLSVVLVKKRRPEV